MPYNLIIMWHLDNIMLGCVVVNLLTADAKLAVTMEKVERMSDDVSETKEILKELAKEVQCIKRALPNKLDERLRTLEGWRSYSTGVTVVIATLVTMVASSLFNWLKGGIK